MKQPAILATALLLWTLHAQAAPLMNGPTPPNAVLATQLTSQLAAQRVRWFKKGIDSGEVAQCDTFRARNL